jgi:HEAT repeat protein
MTWALDEGPPPPKRVPIRAVDLRTDAVRDGGRDEILRLLASAPWEGRASDRPCEFDGRWLACTLGADFAETLPAILGDDHVPAELRIGAAVVLRATAAYEEARASILDLARSGEDAARALAVAVLPAFTGADATPIVVETLREASLRARPAVAGTPDDEALERACLRAFARIGETAEPALAAIVAESGESPALRSVAAAALETMHAKTAFATLLRAAEDPESSVASAALRAAIEIDEGGLEPVLLRALERGGPDDAAIAAWFARYPTEAAAVGLVSALERTLALPADEHGARARALATVRLVLQRVAGEDLGEDPAAWRAWVTDARRDR